MNIKVQRQKPNRGEGAQGEMRLVMMGRGSFLYIKGGNQWYSLNMVATESVNTVQRQQRAELQKHVLTIAGSGDSDHDGTIMDPSGAGAAKLPPAPS